MRYHERRFYKGVDGQGRTLYFAISLDKYGWKWDGVRSDGCALNYGRFSSCRNLTECKMELARICNICNLKRIPWDAVAEIF